MRSALLASFPWHSPCCWPALPPQPIWAEFVTDADFDAGPAKVKMTLLRRGDEWRIVGFWVGPATAPQ